LGFEGKFYLFRVVVAKLAEKIKDLPFGVVLCGQHVLAVRTLKAV
jgi:hypothetical protein